MLDERIHHYAAGAGVSLADCTTQAETDGHAYRIVIKVKTTSADQKSMKPVAAVRCNHCQQSGPMIRLAITTEQVIGLHVDDNRVPYFLFVSHG